MQAGIPLPEYYENADSRKMKYILPAQTAIHIIRSLTGVTYSLAEIGKHIRGRDHASVLHATKVINDMLDTDKNFRLKYDICYKLSKHALDNNIGKYDINNTDSAVSYIVANGYSSTGRLCVSNVAKLMVEWRNIGIEALYGDAFVGK